MKGVASLFCVGLLVDDIGFKYTQRRNDMARPKRIDCSREDAALEAKESVKFQRGYGHPSHPPRQMRFDVSSVRLMDASDRECDPYAIPPNFLATTIAIHLGKRIG